MLYDLTDVEWLVIERLLPNKPRGVKRVDDADKTSSHSTRRHRRAAENNKDRSI